MRDDGVTVVLTTHHMDEAERLADQIHIIDHGRIIAEGTPAELKRSIGADVVTVRVNNVAAAASTIAALPGVDSVEVRGDEILAATADGPGNVSPIAVALAGADIRVRSLTLREPTLDDVFLTLTGEHLDVEGEAA